MEDYEIAEMDKFHYVCVRVNDVRTNPLVGRSFLSPRMASLAIVNEMSQTGDWWRVLEIPPGESTDYDGTVVAEIKTGRLW